MFSRFYGWRHNHIPSALAKRNLTVVITPLTFELAWGAILEILLPPPFSANKTSEKEGLYYHYGHGADQLYTLDKFQSIYGNSMVFPIFLDASKW